MTGTGCPPSRTWTVRDALDWTVALLHGQGRRGAAPLGRVAAVRGDRPDPRRDSTRSTTARSPPEERERLRELVKARAAGTPLQYVTGEVCFRHLVLKVRPGVFIPRPETEVLVDVVLEHLDRSGRAAGTARRGPLHRLGRRRALRRPRAPPRPASGRPRSSEEAADVARANAERCGLAERVTVAGRRPLRAAAGRARRPARCRGEQPAVHPDRRSRRASARSRPTSSRPRRSTAAPDGLDIARRIMAGARGLAGAGRDCSRWSWTRAGAAAAAGELTDLGFEDVSVRSPTSPDGTGSSTGRARRG